MDIVSPSEKKCGLTSSDLHIIAMACMLCDHAWATVIPGNLWLTCLGRIAFPIFAFLLSEGFCYTHDRRAYAKRLFSFALLSELPFNLMVDGLFYPFHQNVIWTFLISFGCLTCIERAKKISNHRWMYPIAVFGISVLGWLIGTLLMVDYRGEGVLLVILFYLFRGRKPWQLVGQAASMVWVNCFALSGRFFSISLFGVSLEFPLQGFALFALPLIWMYRGEQGKKLGRFGYWFYPAHIAVLDLLSYFL